MKFQSIIKNHELTYTNKAYVRHHLSKWEGKRVIVTVEKVHNKRSLNQNAYLWVCLDIISNHTGHSADELHKLFKGMFLPRKVVTLNKKNYSLAGSTTELTKGQFVEYLMRINAEAGDMGIRLPSPEDFKNGLDQAILLTE